MNFTQYYLMEQEYPSTYDPLENMKIGSFEFDNKDGAGAVPNNMDVNYLGFVVYMNAKEFYQLTPSRGSVEIDYEHFENNSIGSPFLEVEEKDDKWKVLSHEGRGRTQTIWKNDGAKIRFPVHVYVRGKKAKNLDADTIKKPFESQTVTKEVINIEGPYYLDGKKV
jgi:hypothetical protein